jgi:hypothetical protein
MRIVARLGVALLVLLVVAIGALAILLPQIVGSDAVRVRIESAAEAALGRPVRYEALDVGLFPPSLIVREPSVAGSDASAPALVRANQVALRVALLPLLSRTVLVDSLVVEGAAVRLVQTADGLDLPSPAEARGKDGSPPAPEAEAGSPVNLALRTFSLTGASVVLEDRSVSPPVTLEIRGIEASASGELDPVALDVSVNLTPGEIRYGDVFQKPAGIAAGFEGRLKAKGDGDLLLENGKLALHVLQAGVTAHLGERTLVTADVAPFDVSGWDEMLPALAEYQPSGQLDIGTLKLSTDPLELHADIGLDGLSAQVPDAGPVAVRGGVAARGQTIETRKLALVAADQTIHVDATVRDLAATPSFQVSTRTVDSDTNQLVSAFAGRRDTFFGLLNWTGDLSGTVGDSLIRSLDGSTTLDIRDGRIVGLSILEATFDAIAGKGGGRSAASVVALAGVLTGKDLEKYYGDDFELLAGTLRVARGVASTRDLRLVYRDYKVELKGHLGLEDGRYEMTGTLTLGKEIDATLADDMGGKSRSKRPAVIPIGLRGSLNEPFDLQSGNPRIAVTSEVVTSLASRYVIDRYAEEIDEAIGVEGASEALRGVIDILGGGKK